MTSGDSSQRQDTRTSAPQDDEQMQPSPHLRAWRAQPDRVVPLEFLNRSRVGHEHVSVGERGPRGSPGQSSSSSDSGEEQVGRLREAATDKLEHHQHSTLASDDESQASESEGDGGDIEEAEFKSAAESSDEETSQDRAIIDDASQAEENPVITAGQLAAMESSDSESLSQLLGGRFKRRAPNRAFNSLRTGRPSRVVLSSPGSSSEVGIPDPCRSHAAKMKSSGLLPLIS
ncbi:hypothetical protein KFL_000090025 [Klebsormidium nitens]|uniref:Uncharacterized protein n=1 Tax=Klebsormidium nitens TaxID=105231 RepID=A0A1Y1HNG9_KLENI|nr:hypothetical protein KFL_000090025 [Klebsormidium nitens]|eukprot:GAQ78156.1 hypothetical protein KFL_000090025 [Klebsormidium nitens]